MYIREEVDTSFRTSTKSVLKHHIGLISASQFDEDSMQDPLLFPPIGIVRDSSFECKSYPWDSEVFEWDLFILNYKEREKHSGNRNGEFLQEVGFIEFLWRHYPRSFVINSTASENTQIHMHNDTKSVISIDNLHYTSPLPRIFFPFCGFFEEDDWQRFGADPLFKSNDVVSHIQREIFGKQMFHIVPHPKNDVGNANHRIHSTRALRTDQCLGPGFYNDIIIPISTKPQDCNYNFGKEKNISKNNLLYACGNEHKWSKLYKGLRSGIPAAFNLLNKTDIDMRADGRSPKEYDEGFWKSKFCFVIPGDTTSTSQSSRAMCAGCVPIFIVSDFRDLPFSNILDYSKFSIRYYSSEFATQNENRDLNRAIEVYGYLQEMVLNGTYLELMRNVEIARDFFNYHKFGSRSPYGAALVSMYQDDINEKNRKK